jgi:hypothetical protein
MSLAPKGVGQVWGARPPLTSLATPTVEATQPSNAATEPQPAAPTATVDVPPGHVKVMKLTPAPLHFDGAVYSKGDVFTLPAEAASELSCLGHVMAVP